MTSKEMETITSMSRANIRCYASEKLIHPARQENGYRAYSEADAGILLKIKLLRSLGLSLDTQSASLSEARLIRIAEQDFGFDPDSGILSVALDPDVERYYLRVQSVP